MAAWAPLGCGAKVRPAVCLGLDCGFTVIRLMSRLPRMGTITGPRAGPRWDNCIAPITGSSLDASLGASSSCVVLCKRRQAEAGSRTADGLTGQRQATVKWMTEALGSARYLSCLKIPSISFVAALASIAPR